MKNKPPCSKCESCGVGNRLVFLRVPGKATAYHAKPVALCQYCREFLRGTWKYARG